MSVSSNMTQRAGWKAKIQMKVGLGLAAAQDTYSCPDGWDKEVTLMKRDAVITWFVDRKTDPGAVAF